MKNKIDDLRNHLFATMEQLLDKDEPMDVNRAKAIANVGQVIINSAMAEVKAMRALKGHQNKFFSSPQIEAPKK